MIEDFNDITTRDDALKVCVFGASSGRIHPDFAQQAYELGTLIGQKGWTCLNGAGSEGLMRAVSDGTLDAGGTAIGVIPKFMVDNGWHYDRLTSMIITPDMHERKQTLANMADAFVALPGGCGTFEELLEIFTWRQLNILSKPLVVLNTRNYYEPLINMVQQAIDQGFMKASHASLWSVVDNPADAVKCIESSINQGVTKAENKY